MREWKLLKSISATGWAIFTVVELYRSTRFITSAIIRIKVYLYQPNNSLQMYHVLRQEVDLSLYFTYSKADWVSWHAYPLFFWQHPSLLWTTCFVLFLVIAHNQSLMSRLNEWLCCWQCFCTSKTITKRHELSLWHLGSILNINPCIWISSEAVLAIS